MTHPSSKHALRQVLLISAIALALLFGFGLWLVKKQGVFDNNLSLRFTANTGEHLNTGMKLMFQGFPIGHVSALELRADGQIEGRLMIREKYRGLATQGSQIELSANQLVGTNLVWKKNETNTALLANDATLVLDHQDLAHALEQKIMDKLDPAIGRIMAMSTEVMDPNKGLPATLQHINATLVSTEKLLNGLNARAQDPRVDHLLTHLDEASASVVKSAELTEKNMAQTKLVLESTKQTLDSVHGLVHHSNETLEDFRRGTLGRWIAPPRKAASNPQ